MSYHLYRLHQNVFIWAKRSFQSKVLEFFRTNYLWTLMSFLFSRTNSFNFEQILFRTNVIVWHEIVANTLRQTAKKLKNCCWIKFPFRMGVSEKKKFFLLQNFKTNKKVLKIKNKQHYNRPMKLDLIIWFHSFFALV